MVKHIVLFKFKEFSSKEDKELKIKEIKQRLEALKNLIQVLKFIKVGINQNPKEDFDLCLDTEFDNMQDLETYAVHPDHVAVVKIIKEVIEKRACVDSII
jgi:hypothetical protein